MTSDGKWLLKLGAVSFIALLFIQKIKGEDVVAGTSKPPSLPPPSSPKVIVTPPESTRGGSYTSVNVPYYTSPPTFQGSKAIPALVIVGYWSPKTGEDLVEYLDQSGTLQLVTKPILARYLAENNMTRD